MSLTNFLGTASVRGTCIGTTRMRKWIKLLIGSLGRRGKKIKSY